MRTRVEQTERFRGDAGVAVVEMALVGTLLVFLLFGIVIYGYLMSFRQNMTQAAAEAARAGAVAPTGYARSAAQLAASNAVNGFNQTCNSRGMSCVIPDPAPCSNNPLATCITVTLRYNYRDYKLLPDIPLIGQFIPDNFETKATAEINT